MFFIDWCFDFNYHPTENTEEIYCKELDVQIRKTIDVFEVYHRAEKIKIVQNKATVKNIIKILDDIFSKYVESNL